MNRSKRYLLTSMTGAILSALAALALLKQMETVASACVAGIMTILSVYLWGETNRPSKKKK